MRHLVLAGALLALVWGGEASAYRAAAYCPDTTDSSCVVAGVGESFVQEVWAWAPQQRGLVYVTLRFEFPGQLDLRTTPELEEVVLELVTTHYPDGSEEWHLVLQGCPPGWVRLFRQTVTVLDDTACSIGIRGADSWIRDCSFALERVEIVNELSVNAPGCAAVEGRSASWGLLKAMSGRN